MSSVRGGPLLLDTSVLVEALRPSGRVDVRSAVYDAVDDGVAIIIGLIRVELLRGARDRAMFQQLATLLDGVVTVPTGPQTWARAADLGFTLQRLGVAVPTTDIVIAASALENEATVMHLDRHFEFIAGASELRQIYGGRTESTI